TCSAVWPWQVPCPTIRAVDFSLLWWESTVRPRCSPFQLRRIEHVTLGSHLLRCRAVGRGFVLYRDCDGCRWCSVNLVLHCRCDVCPVVFRLCGLSLLSLLLDLA